ncbi:MAG TPA: M20/M25/M40 family metallo-hydrolase [Gemmatimonadales bacterium]|nr:M20/M25/M40 family metallo-hydrolase [Gemmatimonadales bacterium]
MNRPISVALLALALAAPLAAQTPEIRDIQSDVRYLADDRLAGRKLGSPGADSAADYLARRFQRIGLQPGPQGWFQSFTVDPTAPAAAHAGLANGAGGRNVVAVLIGRDRHLRDEIIVVGAHYDHLGLGGFGSMSPDSTGKVHNGADDNASGVAAILAIAKRLKDHRPARTVVFIAFTGEEEGLLGSSYYVKHPLYPMARTVAMLNFDMVGRLRDDKLIVYGAATSNEWPRLLDSLNAGYHFDLKASGDGYGPSDHASFYAMKRPVLHFFTDLHEDYHRTTDDYALISTEGIARVADYAADVVGVIGDRAAPLSFVDLPPPQPAAGTGPAVTPGYGAYLGSIPDMSESPGGVRITGVRAGSPAEAAGLKGGDIIVRMGEIDVPDLQAMTDVLRSHKAGDTVDLVYVRDGQRVTTKVTFGVRGGS